MNKVRIMKQDIKYNNTPTNTTSLVYPDPKEQIRMVTIAFPVPYINVLSSAITMHAANANAVSRAMHTCNTIFQERITPACI